MTVGTDARDHRRFQPRQGEPDHRPTQTGNLPSQPGQTHLHSEKEWQASSAGDSLVHRQAGAGGGADAVAGDLRAGVQRHLTRVSDPDEAVIRHCSKSRRPARARTGSLKATFEGFFDNIDHAKLLQILARKIADGRFLNLIEKFLKAGYLEFRQVHHSLTGTPQGGIVSPILANIYLHELDVYMEALCQRYTTSRHTAQKRRLPGTQPGTLPGTEERRLCKQPRRCSNRCEPCTPQDPLDPNYIKVKYCRYADDFIVMIIGSKRLAAAHQGGNPGFSGNPEPRAQPGKNGHHQPERPPGPLSWLRNRQDPGEHQTHQNRSRGQEARRQRNASNCWFPPMSSGKN